MSWRRTRHQPGEGPQANIFSNIDWTNGLPWPWGMNPDYGHHRSAPAEMPYVEYDPELRGWYQGSRRMPRNFKSNKYWARPCDGKRTGTWGRLKDGLTGEGPDVFVVLNGDRRKLMRDMPHRTQWSGWNGFGWDPNWGYSDPDDTPGFHYQGWAPWTNKRLFQRYNFKTRDYEGPRKLARRHAAGDLWTDAYWKDGARRRDMEPISYRTKPGRWATQVPRSAGFYSGGRPIR